MSGNIDNLRDPLGLLCVSFVGLFSITAIVEVVILDLGFGEGLRALFLVTMGTVIAKLLHNDYGVETTVD